MAQAVQSRTLSEKRLEAIDRYWRAANFLTAGQIYLKENFLLREPLKPEHIKKRLLGHWGTSPGLNLIYAGLNRLIQDTNVKLLYITGPGHGGPALRANVYLEGTMTETYPEISRDRQGIGKLMREFSWPGGVPSHVSPPTPGSIHEGGELGYSLVHAFGAAFDNPDLIVACVVGDGEAETGPLAASWQSVRFLNPKRDGAVLPILHLNGYKISGPTLFGRMEPHQLNQFFEGCGYQVRVVEGEEPLAVHEALAQALDWAHDEIRAIQAEAIVVQEPARWPLIVLRTPKGWTGPKVVDGKQIEGTFRSHQVPIADVIENPDHLKILEGWLRSYRPEELFDSEGRVQKEVLEILPPPELQMGRTPHANGGLLLRNLHLPPFEPFAVVPHTKGEATRVLGKWLREVMQENPKNFRVVCPDETNSNRLGALFEVTNRTYLGQVKESDDHLAADGRVMEVLSEHLCQGWLEGYLLTGRHGLFPCYEAFALIVDSMLNQHGKWLKACEELPWREPIASLNYLLTSHAWRQDHNGYSHQGPGFIESVMQKKSSVARIYLPPDANCLLSVTDHCLRSRNYINLIVCGKQTMPQWLSMEAAKRHCAQGASIWEWASTPGTPDLVLAASGDVPTLEIMAATSLIRKAFPDLRVQVVNVVDLFTLVDPTVHPHGMNDERFFHLFPERTPAVFAFHGHPTVIHEQVYRRDPERRFHVRGYIEEGTTTTPFDMVVLNGMSRYDLAIQGVLRVGRTPPAEWAEVLERHPAYIHDHGEDLPEIQNWKWDL
ncbi:MAG: phosphoketolase [Parachlamydiales bacterium]